MRAEDVIAVLDALDGAGVRFWIGGGWGVVALAGRQTREHRDLDLAVQAEDLPACLAVLSDLGYVAETDWLPVRIELAAAGARWVDVHPVRFTEGGRGRQAGLGGTHFDYLCVPITSSTSCDQPIFVDHATDVSLFSDAVQVEVDRLGQRFQRRGAVQKAVRPVLIVVGLVVAQDPPPMGLVPDEGAVQELAAAAADPAFGDRVHAWRPHVAEHGPDPGVRQDRAERGGEV